MMGLVLAVAAAAAPTQAAGATPGAWKFKELGAGTQGARFFQAEVVSNEFLVDINHAEQKAGFAVKCDAKGLYVDIIWPMTVTGDTYDGTKADVLLKVDNGHTREAKLRKTDMAVMALGKEGYGLLKDLANAETLTVRVPDLYGGQTATFRVAGIQPLYDRIKAQGCS